MAFAKSSNFTISHSKFVDKSIINKITTSDTKNHSGDGVQRLLNAISMDASFDSQARYPPPRCDENTRRALLEHILQWIDSGKEDILFLHGPAGAGKSAVAQTVAGICAEKNILAGSYFFFRGSPSRNTITPLIPTITYDITSSTSRKRKKVEGIVKRDPSILDKSPEVQLNKLILEPHRRSLFLRIFWIKRKLRFIIIDGLDECNGDDDQRRIIKLISQLVDKKHAIVRCLIASRPEPQILSAVSSLPSNITVAQVTLNEDSWDAKSDIRIYLRSHFDDISARLPLSTPRPWPSDETLEMLVKKAGGIFIYASTVVKYINDEDALPMTQLEHVLKLSPGTTPFAELDLLYQQILMACPSQHRATLLHIFGFIFLRNPVFEDVYNISLIEALLNLSPGEVAVVLRRMHSILSITPSGSSSSISFLHASFGDFIFSEQRSGDFFIDRERESLFLATKCIDCMSCHGKGLDSISMSDAAMKYAWNSWVYHGKNAGDSYLTDLVRKLRHCDKSLWIKALPENHYRACTDGLDTGITWLERYNVGGSALNISVIIEELGRKLAESILAISRYPKVLGMFEDPGIDFFGLDCDYIVALDCDYVAALVPNDGSPILLYIGYQGKAHDLGRWDARMASRVFGGLPHRWDINQQEIVAIQCLYWLKSPEEHPGLQYAAKYWAKHISLSGADHGLLSALAETELREIKPEHQVTLADVNVVAQWLEVQSNSIPSYSSDSTKANKANASAYREERELVSLWKGHCREFESGSSLGLCTSLWKKRLAGVWPGPLHSRQRPLDPLYIRN